MIEKYPVEGIVVMGKYSLSGRNHLKKFRLLGMTDGCSWCTLFNIRESTNDELSQQRPKASADRSSLASLPAMIELQALPLLLVPDGPRSLG
jgi:hypothetical protein